MLKHTLSTALLCLLLLVFPNALTAQEGSAAFQFLQLPFSAHAAALGGENISIIEDDLTMAAHNPALLSCVSDKTLNLNYMNYMSGVSVASAAFSRLSGERGAWAVTAQYMGYGELTETTAENVALGTFSPKDLALSGMYSYDLSDYWSGGARGSFIHSRYADYSSIAVGIDLGLNYYNPNSDFSFSVTARNLGAQLKAFGDRRDKLPTNVQVGFSKRMAHAPFRISVTLNDLTRWSDTAMSTRKFGKKLLNHVVIGMDLLLSQNFYIAAGYNLRRSDQMQVNGSSHWAGFTAGAGLQIKRFKLGAAYGKYHVSSSSFVFNLAYSL